MPLRRSSRAGLWLALAIAMAFASPFFSNVTGEKGDESGPDLDLGTWGRHIHLEGGRRDGILRHPEHTSDTAFAWPFSSNGGMADASGPDLDLGTWGRHIHLEAGRRDGILRHPEHTSDMAFSLPFSWKAKGDKDVASGPEFDLLGSSPRTVARLMQVVQTLTSEPGGDISILKLEGGMASCVILSTLRTWHFPYLFLGRRKATKMLQVVQNLTWEPGDDISVFKVIGGPDLFPHPEHSSDD